MKLKGRPGRLILMEDTEGMVEESRADQAEDEAWVREAQAGDLEAFNRLVLKYQNRAFALAFDILQHAQDARDMAQEAFIRAFRKLKGFQGKARFSTWFYRILINVCRSHLRWLGVRKWVWLSANSDRADQAMEPVDPGPSPLDAVRQDEKASLIEKALWKLTPEARMVISLRDIQGLSYEEIAKTFGIDEGTMKSRLFRARAQLRDLLKEDF